MLAEVAVTFAAALLVVTAVLFTGQTLQQMNRTQGLEWTYLLSILPALLPIAIAYASPFAFLIAVAFTFGRMVADREVTALRIAGVHPRVVVVPVAAMGALLSLASLASAGWWIPHAKQEFNQQLMNNKEMFLSALGGSDEPITFRNFRFSYAQYDPPARTGEAGTFRDFELDQRDDEGNLLQKTLGDEARLRGDGEDLVLETGLAWVLAEDEAKTTKGAVDVGPRRVKVGHVERLGASTAFNELLGQSSYERKAPDVDLPDLWYMVERGRAAETARKSPKAVPTPDEAARIESIEKVPFMRSLVELHARLASSFAPFVFGLVAVAVALHLPSRGRRLLGVLLAFLPVVLIHFPLTVGGKSLADARTLPPWIAMWIADGVLLVAALVLLRRAYAR